MEPKSCEGKQSHQKGGGLLGGALSKMRRLSCGGQAQSVPKKQG
ncbi:hypothetical protein [Campylobacter felis]|nr:hypothetical protein [Campylobacter felis]